MKLLAVIGIVICGFMSVSSIAEESREQEATEKRAIDLSEIITTSPQPELRPIKVAWEKDDKQPPGAFGNVLHQIQSINNGASSVFLVDAKNTQDGIFASLSVLIGWRSADTPATVNTGKPRRGSHWLVAYLGAGPSTPTWWTIKSITVAKSKVILSYSASKPSPATADVVPYLYWVELGALTPGSYELQLFDADRGELTLMRRVEVAPGKEKGGPR